MSPRPAYARQRVDAHQKATVAALRAAGWDVEIIGRPLDLLLAKRGFTMLVEVKPPGKEKRKDQPRQQEFMQKWKGVCCYAFSPEDAVAKAEAELERWRRT